MASDILLRTILIVRKETRCCHIGYSFRLTARVLLYAPSPTDRKTHTTAFVTPVVEHWLEREIAQRVHPMKDRSDDTSHHERTLLPRSYISLPGSKEGNVLLINDALNTFYLRLYGTGSCKIKSHIPDVGNKPYIILTACEIMLILPVLGNNKSTGF